MFSPNIRKYDKIPKIPKMAILEGICENRVFGGILDISPKMAIFGYFGGYM